jgi:integrase
MSVRKRGSTWYIDICEKGKRRITRALKGVRTKAQAEKLEAVVRTQILKGRYDLLERVEMLFEKFVTESFLPYSKLNKKSYTSDVCICKPLCAFFGNQSIAKINAPMIEQYKQKRTGEITIHGKLRSPSRVNKELIVLSKILSMACEAELMLSKPKIRQFKVSAGRIRYLKDEEEIRLFEALQDCEWLRNIVIFALNTGMRRGEIFGLQWFDVDFTRQVLKVRYTKNGKDRAIPMNQTVRELLSSMPKTNEYVFASPKTGGKLTDLKKKFQAARKKAKLEDFRFHDIRHTFATRMGDAGVDIFTLAELLGHSDIRITKRYAHGTEENKRQAVEKLVKDLSLRDKSVTNEKGQTVQFTLNH